MKADHSITVSEFLKRDNNNLDLFRVIAACMVIVGHSYVLFPNGGHEDLIRSWTKFTYSGALAVKIFFFISGLVVTNSLLQKRNASAFATARIFRIFPALLFLLLISALVIAPFLSGFTLSQYFDTPATYNYIKENFVLKTNYSLPRLFEANHYRGAVNGSLWTLPVETGCYLFLLGIFLIGAFSRRAVANTVLLVVIIDTLLPQPFFLQWLGTNTELSYLPASFAVGALLAVNADRLAIRGSHFAGFAILSWLLWHTRLAEFMYCLSAFAFVAWVSSLPFFIKLKPKYDFSYGIYLWGFFVQQCMENLMPNENMFLKMFLSLVISILLGAVSWFVIEERAIGAGKKLWSMWESRRESSLEKDLKEEVQ